MVDDGNDGDQVDIKIPLSNFRRQRASQDEDLIFDSSLATRLPQTKLEFHEFQKMAKFRQ